MNQLSDFIGFRWKHLSKKKVNNLLETIFYSLILFHFNSSARSSGVKCNSNSSRQHGMKLPGFPQRILPSASEQPSSSSSSPGMTKKPTTQLQETNVVEEEELLKFDDIPNSAPLAASQIMMPKQNDFFSSNPRPKMTDFDLRFEFSETRKVLEEFFPPISKTALNSMHEEDPLARAGSKDFNELEYTLRRRSPVSNEQGKQLISSLEWMTEVVFSSWARNS